MIFSEQIGGIISALKATPELTDKVEYVDFIREPLLEGPSDLYHVAFYLSRISSQEVILRELTTGPGNYLATGFFQVLAVSQKPRIGDPLLPWLLYTLTNTKTTQGERLTIRMQGYSDNAESIYLEETGKELKWELGLIRIRFQLDDFLYVGSCEPDVCEQIQCLYEV